MGNGADFFSRDEEGRQSEYVSVGKAQTVEGIKGRIVKKKGDKETHAARKGGQLGWIGFF